MYAFLWASSVNTECFGNETERGCFGSPWFIIVNLADIVRCKPDCSGHQGLVGRPESYDLILLVTMLPVAVNKSAGIYSRVEEVTELIY